MIFIRMLKKTIHAYYWTYLIIWLLKCLVLNNLIKLVTQLFVKGRKLNISLVFITKIILLYQNIRLNSTHYFIAKIPNKQELQQIAFNPSSMFIMKTLSIFAKNVLQNHISSRWFSVLFHQTILYVSERIT